MYLHPVRRSGHDIKHVDTIQECLPKNLIVAMCPQVIAYHETMKTWSSDVPELCELLHNIIEEF